jgi:hypothetical protein
MRRRGARACVAAACGEAGLRQSSRSLRGSCLTWPLWRGTLQAPSGSLAPPRLDVRPSCKRARTAPHLLPSCACLPQAAASFRPLSAAPVGPQPQQRAMLPSRACLKQPPRHACLLLSQRRAVCSQLPATRGAPSVRCRLRSTTSCPHSSPASGTPRHRSGCRSTSMSFTARAGPSGTARGALKGPCAHTWPQEPFSKQGPLWKCKSQCPAPARSHRPPTVAPAAHSGVMRGPEPGSQAQPPPEPPSRPMDWPASSAPAGGVGVGWGRGRGEKSCTAHM